MDCKRPVICNSAFLWGKHLQCTYLCEFLREYQIKNHFSSVSIADRFKKNTFDTCKMVISCCFEWVWRILLNGKWMDVKLSTGLLFHKRIVLSEIAFFFFKTCVLTRYFFYIFMWLQCMWMFHKYLVKIQVDKKKNVPS